MKEGDMFDGWDYQADSAPLPQSQQPQPEEATSIAAAPGARVGKQMSTPEFNERAWRDSYEVSHSSARAVLRTVCSQVATDTVPVTDVMSQGSLSLSLSVSQRQRISLSQRQRASVDEYDTVRYNNFTRPHDQLF